MIITPKKGTNIYKRKDGRWEARYLKSINEVGKRIYGSVYGKTFDEAKQKQEEVVRNQSQVTKNNSRFVLTLLEVSAEWKNSIKQTVKESTYLKYETNEKIQGKGEDCGFESFNQVAGLIGVFDGCGGLGSRICPKSIIRFFITTY